MNDLTAAELAGLEEKCRLYTMSGDTHALQTFACTEVPRIIRALRAYQQREAALRDIVEHALTIIPRGQFTTSMREDLDRLGIKP